VRAQDFSFCAILWVVVDKLKTAGQVRQKSDGDPVNPSEGHRSRPLGHHLWLQPTIEAAFPAQLRTAVGHPNCARHPEAEPRSTCSTSPPPRRASSALSIQLAMQSNAPGYRRRIHFTNTRSETGRLRFHSVALGARVQFGPPTGARLPSRSKRIRVSFSAMTGLTFDSIVLPHHVLPLFFHVELYLSPTRNSETTQG